MENDHLQKETERLNGVFANLSQAGFNARTPLVWSFCFFAEASEILEQIALELRPFGYECEISVTNESGYRLISSKAEVLTPQKLAERNTSFDELARHYRAEYDGWEVAK